MPDTSTVYDQLTAEVNRYGATLVAVSKTKPIDQIMALYELGQRDFGENRAAELAEKYKALPKDIRWHFIGHLQRKKVKTIAPFVHLIHSVDSERLLREIDKQAVAHGRELPVLLQFHIARESTKYGLDDTTASELLSALTDDPLRRAYVAGVMGMATYTDDVAQVEQEFKQLSQIAANYRKGHFAADDRFREISMGMSGDFQIALAQGSTLVRVGSLLFGGR